jgi:hypothetical protein
VNGDSFVRYRGGTEVKLGDIVSLDGKRGRVVCVFDEELYESGYPKFDWDHLGTGVLIDFIGFGPVHYEDGLEDDISFVERLSR